MYNGLTEKELFSAFAEVKCIRNVKAKNSVLKGMVICTVDSFNLEQLLNRKA